VIVLAGGQEVAVSDPRGRGVARVLSSGAIAGRDAR
jgi:hypothetical protein